MSIGEPYNLEITATQGKESLEISAEMHEKYGTISIKTSKINPGWNQLGAEERGMEWIASNLNFMFAQADLHGLCASVEMEKDTSKANYKEEFLAVGDWVNTYPVLKNSTQLLKIEEFDLRISFY